MTKLVQRLQRTRDRVYNLSDKFGVVNHVDAEFVHRIHRSRHTVTPRPRLIEPTTRVLYNFNLSQTVEVNKDDKLLVGISRAGFENFDRIKSAPDGAIPELHQYSKQVLEAPIIAGYYLTVGRATDVSVASHYPPEEIGSSTFVSVTDTVTNRTVYSKSFIATSDWVARNLTLKAGSYFVATQYSKVLPVIYDPVKSSTISLNGAQLERTAAVSSLGGVVSHLDGGYTPLSVSWGTDQSFDFVYNGAICYLGGKPHTILWVDDNRSLDYAILVRPERSR